MKKVGIRQVAERAGVSVATVSYVMSGNGRVSNETRANVLKAADALGFIRNETAARLRSGQSRLVGVILNNIENPFFSQLVGQLETVAYSEGYLTVLATAQNDSERQSRLLQSMVSQGVAAIILSPVHDTAPEDLQPALGRGIPVVVCVRDVPGSKAAFVGVDDTASGYLAARAVFDAGHAAAVFVGGYDHTTTWIGRRAGIDRALAERGWDATACISRPGPLSPDFAAAEVTSMHRSGTLPDAVICFNDDLATGVYAAARTLGLGIGHALSVVSFDNVPISRALEPQLTSVDIHPGQIGRLAAERAIALVAGQSVDREPTRLDPVLVRRKSLRS